MANLGKLTVQVIRFEQMADLPDFTAKQKALLRKCDEAYATAEVGRTFTTKSGDENTQPDCAAMIKCIELAARLLGVIAEAEKIARNDDGGARGVEIQQLLSLLRSMGYKITEPPKAA